jgi:hypothetical protein
MHSRCFPALAALLILAGCGGPARFDGSSHEAFGRSLEALQDLPEAERAEVAAALARLMAAEGGPDPLAGVRQTVDGLTVAQVLELARQVEVPPGVTGPALEAARRAATNSRADSPPSPSRP